MRKCVGPVLSLVKRGLNSEPQYVVWEDLGNVTSQCGVGKMIGLRSLTGCQKYTFYIINEWGAFVSKGKKKKKQKLRTWRRPTHENIFSLLLSIIDNYMGR